MIERGSNSAIGATAPTDRDARAAAGPITVAERLLREGYAFDFFQAVRLLEQLAPQRRPVGREGPPANECVRFRSLLSMSFPPSTVCDVSPAAEPNQPPTMVVAFLGLFGPSGTLPLHYTDLLLRMDREAKGASRRALRDWLDLFNHRLIALFHRVWEKYRFPVAFARGEYGRPETFTAPGQDSFTRGLFSLVGLGTPALRDRLRVGVKTGIHADGQRPSQAAPFLAEDGESAERTLVRIEDLGLLRSAGLLAQRPRNALGLQALLTDFVGLPVRVDQFQGQWLRLEAGAQSRLGGDNNVLGISAVAGERVWDVQGKIRLRLGPLSYGQFLSFLPDRTPVPERKAFFLLAHLTRLYVGPELDFEVQLAPRAGEVPPCRLAAGDGLGPRLGWNTWLVSQPLRHDPEDAVFEANEVRWLA